MGEGLGHIGPALSQQGGTLGAGVGVGVAFAITAKNKITAKIKLLSFDTMIVPFVSCGCHIGIHEIKNQIRSGFSCIKVG